MPWFYVDDRMHSHLKFENVPNSAVGLWARIGSWCAQNLTDGTFPASIIKKHKGRPRDVEALLAAGLWEENNAADGYRFHDWIQCNPSKERILERRAEDAARKRSLRPPKKVHTPAPVQPARSNLPDVGQSSGKAQAKLGRKPPHTPATAPEQSPQLTLNVGTESLRPSPDPLTQEEIKKEDPPPAILLANVVPIRKSDIPPPPPVAAYRTGDVIADFERLRIAAGGEELIDAERKCHSLLQGVLKWAKKKSPENTRDVCLRSMSNFFADDWHSQRGSWPIQSWAAKASVWFTTKNSRKRNEEIAPTPYLDLNSKYRTTALGGE